jgi:hypothetical protein
MAAPATTRTTTRRRRASKRSFNGFSSEFVFDPNFPASAFCRPQKRKKKKEKIPSLARWKELVDAVRPKTSILRRPILDTCGGRITRGTASIAGAKNCLLPCFVLFGFTQTLH